MRARAGGIFGAVMWGAMCLLAATAVLVVAVGVVRGVIDRPAPSAEPMWAWTVGQSLSLLVRTIAVALGIGVLSTMLALPAAWAMRRWTLAVPVMLGATMLLPAYLVHAALSLARAPGTWPGDLLEGGPARQWIIVNHAQAIIGLSLWATPLAAGVLAPALRAVEREALDALRLSGAGCVTRARLVLAEIRGALIGAVMLVGAVMLGSAVPLHLAQAETWSIVVWRAMAETGASPAAWAAAAPMLLGAGVIGWALTSRLFAPRAPESPGAHADRGVSIGWLFGAGAVWAAATIGPIAMFAAEIRSARVLGNFWVMNGEAVARSALIAAIVALICGTIAAGTWAGLSPHAAPLARALTRGALRAWVVLALTPGILIGAAMSEAASLPGMNWLTETPGGLILAHAARFGAVGALAGWWVRRQEPTTLGAVRGLYAGEGSAAGLRAIAPLFAGTIAPAMIGAGMLSFHEIEAAVMVSPAGAPTFPQRMLSMLHYLRDDELAAAVVVVSGTAILGACVLLGFVASSRRVIGRTGNLLALLLLSVVMIGCDDRASGHVPGAAARLPERVIGSLGRGGGQFIYPRCVDTDGESLWVIDKAARVQRLSLDGAALGGFTMPRREKGMPTGITIGPDGLLYIADTHEHRVAVFDASAKSDEVLQQWGTYGFGDGQFVFPTDVAIAPGADGRTPERFYVSEYGGNDRVSVFDARCRFLFAIGAPGLASDAAGSAGIVFSRPQSLVYDARAKRLIVVDAANHRLGVFTLDGELIRWIGRADGTPGQALGEFCYPYGIALLADGGALVSEFGNNRVQHVDLDGGVGVETIGAPGREPGSMVTPWGVAVPGRAGEKFFVLDSGNNRIQEFSLR